MQQYLLTILILLPTVGGIAAIGHSFIYRRETDYRWIALAFSVITFALSLLLLSGDTTGSGFRFVQNIPWINAIGARYHVGVDGISLWLVLLTTLLVPISILSSWTSVKKRTLSYYVFLLVLESAMVGVLRRRAMLNSSSKALRSASRRRLSGSTTSKTARMFSSTFSPRKIEASCGRYPMPSRARWYIGSFVTS